MKLGKVITFKDKKYSEDYEHILEDLFNSNQRPISTSGQRKD